MRLLLRISRLTSILIAILCAMILLPVQPSLVAHAQSGCGNRVTVVPGDTLSRIAVRCNTTVAAILAANPQIRSRNLIYSGQVITLPEGSKNPGGGENPGSPMVTISPSSGSPGSNVQVAVSDFPAKTRISYGLGERGGQLLQVYSARTNALGSLQLTMQVPQVDPNTTLEVVAYVLQPNKVTATSEGFTVTASNSNGDNLFTHTNLYLIALEDGGKSGMEIGCGDSVVPVEVQIEPTIAPLTAALGKLFAMNDRYYGQSGLYNALYQSNLTVDRIELSNGLASIYLTGSLQVGGVCDEPRVRAQLEETALQYSTVNEVQIFVNGQPLAF